MLIKDFYTIADQKSIGDSRHEVRVNLHPDAEVYKGHFPGQPIAPGACLTQMVKEVANGIIGKKLTLVEAQQIKFLATVNPGNTPHLLLEMDIDEVEDGFRLKCVARDDSTSYFKLSGKLA